MNKLKLFIGGLIWVPVLFADSFLYVSSYTEKKIASYKILNNGELEDLHQEYILSGVPEDMGTYNKNGRKYLFLAYSDTNKLAVYKVGDNGKLSLLSEYPTPAKPDPISAVLNDRFLYVNSAGSMQEAGFQFNPDTGILTSLMGSPFATNGSAYGYMFSENGKYLYVQYIYENKIAALAINPNTGEIGMPTSKVSSGYNPMHYTSYNGYLYLVSLGANGISKYRIDGDQGILTPDNQYASENLDYKFDFSPLRMSRFESFLYITDRSNNINIFQINPDSSLSKQDVINCGGITGRSLVFISSGYAYQPVFGSNTINQFEVNPHTGKIRLLNIYPTVNSPMHLAIF